VKKLGAIALNFSCSALFWRQDRLLLGGPLLAIELLLLFLLKLNSVALVCERTIPTKRLPFVGEVNANFADVSW
jgi:hypothetical protein